MKKAFRWNSCNYLEKDDYDKVCLSTAGFVLISAPGPSPVNQLGRAGVRNLI